MRPHRKPVITIKSLDDTDDPESVDGPYLLIQRQFEFPDGDSYVGERYLESDDTRLCGHVKVRAATLSSEFLSIDLLADEWTTLRIRLASARVISKSSSESLQLCSKTRCSASIERLGSLGSSTQRDG